ncbi:MAG: tRNA-dihydrouridine synthase, partial [Burkholderiales bacterium]|nr:tRNA-dihydrouridine synthase [Burkholderiales bacterium]
MRIGPYAPANRVFVAPMAGVTDRPYRQLCKRLGAGYAVSEMAASNPRLWASEKTSRRLNHDGEAEPSAVQLAGADPQMLAEAARYNVARGA